MCQILLCFACANSGNPYNILSVVNYYFFHFMEEEYEAQKMKFFAQDHTAVRDRVEFNLGHFKVCAHNLKSSYSEAKLFIGKIQNKKE